MEKTVRIYISMCDLAFEIQNLWKPAIGDYYFSIEHGKIYLLTHQEIKYKKFNRGLPTEKQLFRLYQKS